MLATSDNEEEESLPAQAAAAQPHKQTEEKDSTKNDEAFAEKGEETASQSSPSISSTIPVSQQEESLSLERTLDESELQRHGMVTREGDMISFVADNFQERLRQSLSPSSRPSPKRRSVSSTKNTSNDNPPIDPKVLDDLELEAKKVAESLELFLRSMKGTLQNMSAVSVGYIQTYRDSVEKIGETADNAVKNMYVLISKCEELNKNMEPMYELHKQMYPFKL